MRDRDPGAKALVFSQFVNMLDVSACLSYRSLEGGGGNMIDDMRSRLGILLA